MVRKNGTKKEITAKQRDALAVFVIVLILAIFLVPIPRRYGDPQVKTYTSLLYKVILWPRQKQGEQLGYRVRLHLFPNNFHALQYYVQFR